MKQIIYSTYDDSSGANKSFRLPKVVKVSLLVSVDEGEIERGVSLERFQAFRRGSDQDGGLVGHTGSCEICFGYLWIAPVSSVKGWQSRQTRTSAWCGSSSNVTSDPPSGSARANQMAEYLSKRSIETPSESHV